MLSVFFFFSFFKSCHTRYIQFELRDFRGDWATDGLNHETHNIRVECMGWSETFGGKYPTHDIVIPKLRITSPFPFSSIQELDKWQKEKRITKFPSLLEFFGYS